MNKLFLFALFSAVIVRFSTEQPKYIARQGQVSFFSYTSVENIEAKNNQVLSLLDFEKGEIAVSMLMPAFVFEKDLMHAHFNESYIESDLYPKANFKGQFIDLNTLAIEEKKALLVKGILQIRGISKEKEIKVFLTKTKEGYLLSGEFNILVKDFEIKIPPILASNIAKTVSVKMNFQYLPYEEKNN